MTATYYMRVVSVQGKKIILLINPSGASENSNEDFNKEFFLAILRDAKHINRSFHDVQKIDIDDKKNVLISEISEANYYSLMKMDNPTPDFHVNNYIQNITHLQNGKERLLTILESRVQEEGISSLRYNMVIFQVTIS